MDNYKGRRFGNSGTLHALKPNVRLQTTNLSPIAYELYCVGFLQIPFSFGICSFVAISFTADNSFDNCINVLLKYNVKCMSNVQIMFT